MKPTEIFDVMDLTRRARAINQTFNPLFVGPPGVGKSQIVQAWCKKNSLPFIDLRLAYLEAPDMIGFPSIEKRSGFNGGKDFAITTHATPEFWPQDPDWEGVILLEEPNRGTTSMMNTVMQLLTDRKVHGYTLPQKALIVSCVNPEGEQYDVNTMDSALRDRFVQFDVSYNKAEFVKYMKASNFDNTIITFINNGLWQYSTPEEMGNPLPAGAKYLSPRSWASMNAAIKANVLEAMQMMIYSSILGSNVGKAFYAFQHDKSPVMYQDLIDSPKVAFSKLKKYSDVTTYEGSMITITVDDIVEKNLIENELLYKVLKVLPIDQASDLLMKIEGKRKDRKLLGVLLEKYPDLRADFSCLKKP